MEFLTACGPQAHFEKVKKKCKTQKQRHRRRTVCFVKNLNGSGDVSTFYDRQRHRGFTVCFVTIVNGAGVLQHVARHAKPGRPRSQKGAGPDLAEKLPILLRRTIEKWSFLEGGPGGRPGGGPGRSPEVVRDEVGGKSTRRSRTPLRRRPGRHPRVGDRKCLDAKRKIWNRCKWTIRIITTMPIASSITKITSIIMTIMIKATMMAMLALAMTERRQMTATDSITLRRRRRERRSRRRSTDL